MSKKQLEDKDVFVKERLEGETYEEYKERRKRAKGIMDRRLKGKPIHTSPAPNNRQRRRKSVTMSGGNTPFVRTDKRKMSKAEKKQYKKKKREFRTANNLNSH